jgi:hypothetical protein
MVAPPRFTAKRKEIEYSSRFEKLDRVFLPFPLLRNSSLRH